MPPEYPQQEDKALHAYQPHITVRAAGRLWQISRATDLEQLWEAMTADTHDFDDERLPYWTELWPSSVALASWLYSNRICGRPVRVVDDTSVPHSQRSPQPS